MHRRCVVMIGVLSAFAVHAFAAPPTPMCRPDERVVFSCHGQVKRLAVCATGDLTTGTGALTYRFGRTDGTVELEYASTPESVRQRFAFDYEPWAKGEASTLAFAQGRYRYEVYHAHGAFGVDGGPNRAGVRVQRDGKPVADIACDESSAADHFYEQLHGAGLGRAPWSS